MARISRFALLVVCAAILLSVFMVSSASAESIDPNVVDTIAPTTISAVRQTDSHEWTIKLFATDDAGGSGVAKTYYQLDQQPEVEGTIIVVNSPGRHTLTYWSVDNAGNVETAKTREFTPLDLQIRCATCHGLGGGGQ